MGGKKKVAVATELWTQGKATLWGGLWIDYVGGDAHIAPSSVMEPGCKGADVGIGPNRKVWGVQVSNWK